MTLTMKFNLWHTGEFLNILPQCLKAICPTYLYGYVASLAHAHVITIHNPESNLVASQSYVDTQVLVSTCLFAPMLYALSLVCTL